MKSRLLILIITLITVLSMTEYALTRDRVNYSCTSQFHGKVNFPNTEMTSQLNVFASVYQAQRMYLNIDGQVRLNGQYVHINREVVFRYEILDKKNALMRVLPISRNLKASDTVNDPRIESMLLGIEEGGKLVRLWKINDKVILVGNAFSPIFSCIAI